jgi:hypothetical protein
MGGSDSPGAFLPLADRKNKFPKRPTTPHPSI